MLTKLLNIKPASLQYSRSRVIIMGWFRRKKKEEYYIKNDDEYFQKSFKTVYEGINLNIDNRAEKFAKPVSEILKFIEVGFKDVEFKKSHFGDESMGDKTYSYNSLEQILSFEAQQHKMGWLAIIEYSCKSSRDDCTYTVRFMSPPKDGGLLIEIYPSKDMDIPVSKATAEER